MIEKVKGENSLAHESAELGALGLRGVLQDEALAGVGLGGAAERDGREGLDVEVGAVRAALDELRGEREDGARAQGRVEGGGHGLGARGGADQRLVAALDRDDGRRGAEDGRVADERGRAQVRRHAHGLEDARRL